MSNKIDTLTKLDTLNIKAKNINNWIKDNPQETEPNMSEIIECWCEYGECLHKLKEYYDKNGYPAIQDGPNNYVRATHHDIWKIDPESIFCIKALSEMEQLRNLESHEFLKDPAIKDLFSDLKYKVIEGEYDIPKNPTIAKMKKELLCKTMSVPFYIWKTKQNEPDYQYDNSTEWMMMQEYYQYYKDEAGIQTTLKEKDADGNSVIKYKGPQFGQHIESIFTEIEKTYKFNQSPISI